MGIFDIFTCKKQLKSILSKDNISAMLSAARESIIEQAKQAIPGQEKKDNVDQVIIGLISTRTSGYNNSIAKWVVSLIINAVPSITQLVYDFLKEKVKNL